MLVLENLVVLNLETTTGKNEKVFYSVTGYGPTALKTVSTSEDVYNSLKKNDKIKMILEIVTYTSKEGVKGFFEKWHIMKID